MNKTDQAKKEILEELAERVDRWADMEPDSQVYHPEDVAEFHEAAKALKSALEAHERGTMDQAQRDTLFNELLDVSNADWVHDSRNHCRAMNLMAHGLGKLDRDADWVHALGRKPKLVTIDGVEYQAIT